MNLQWHKTREKDVVGIVTFDLIVLLPTNHIIILQRHTGVYEETPHVNNTKYLKFYCRKVKATEEMANFGSCPGDFRL